MWIPGGSSSGSASRASRSMSRERISGRSNGPRPVSASLSHPQYPAQRHVMSVYEVADSDPAVRFAAGEFSNGVWGFYVPAQ
jgi:hypothetical protein